MVSASPWWHDAIGYSLYIRSFSDSDGDGVGDLAGIAGHLDHLEELGVDLVWISPFYPSPLADLGYDITDHVAIDALYGDLAGFDRLLHEIHQRGMRLLLDLVPNHTSREHEWFVRSRAEPRGPHRDYYIWRDPAPDGGPPNDWVSYFGGPAWTFDADLGQYYLHLFLPEQPDLNWRNPAVGEEFERILRFWLERGVDGFRVDAAQTLVKDEQLRSNPIRTPIQPDMDRREQWQAFDHRYDIVQAESGAIFATWRNLCRAHGAILVGETSVATADSLALLLPGTGLDLGFWLAPAQAGWQAGELRDALGAPFTRALDPRAIAWVASTLDEPRPATRFGGGDRGRRRALALSTLLFFLPGVPFLYQGEELGLVDGHVPESRRADPVGEAVEDSRDGCRTPMPWGPGTSFGFSSAADPWLPIGDRSDADTVAYQRGRSGSWFARYRALIELRKSTAELRQDGVEPWELGADDLVAFRRGDLGVVANLGDRPIELGQGGEVLYDTHDAGAAPGSGLMLQPDQALVVRTATP